MSYRNWKHILGIFNFHNSVSNRFFFVINLLFRLFWFYYYYYYYFWNKAQPQCWTFLFLFFFFFLKQSNAKVFTSQFSIYFLSKFSHGYLHDHQTHQRPIQRSTTIIGSRSTIVNHDINPQCRKEKWERKTVRPMDRECEKKVNKKEEKILQKAVVLCISSQVHLRAFLCRFFTMMLTNLA